MIQPRRQLEEKSPVKGDLHAGICGSRGVRFPSATRLPPAESGPARIMQVAAAKAVCARCPVREQCLTEALARIPYGIAGGLTEHERRRLCRNQHIASATGTGTGTGRVVATAGELGE